MDGWRGSRPAPPDPPAPPPRCGAGLGAGPGPGGASPGSGGAVRGRSSVLGLGPPLPPSRDRAPPCRWVRAGGCGAGGNRGEPEGAAVPGALRCDPRPVEPPPGGIGMGSACFRAPPSEAGLH